MTVIYIDSVFVLNAVMDYLLLLCTGRLAGIPLRRFRYVMAALAGGLYAAGVFFPHGSWLAHPLVKLLAGVLMALIAFGREERFMRLLLLMALVSCAMAGCVLALGLLSGGAVPVIRGVFYTDFDARVLLIAVTAAWLVLTLVFRAAARQSVQGRLLPVRICLRGRVTELTALWDTGNGLRDGGGPALIVAPGVADTLLPRSVRGLLSKNALRYPASVLEMIHQTHPELQPRLAPYRAVGTSGLLLTIGTDWLEINGIRRENVRLALSPTDLGEGYTALWGGE